jgi:hypothetical protein
MFTYLRRRNAPPFLLVLRQLTGNKCSTTDLKNFIDKKTQELGFPRVIRGMTMGYSHLMIPEARAAAAAIILGYTRVVLHE